MVVGYISARHVFVLVTARNMLRLLELPASHFLRVTADIDAPCDIKNTAIVCHTHGASTCCCLTRTSAKFHIDKLVSSIFALASVHYHVLALLTPDTLGHVIARMDAARIHRIFVVGADGRLRRVVALCDVIEQFVAVPDSSCSPS